MSTVVTVADMIRLLEQVQDKSQPVLVRKYSCGSTFVETLKSDEVSTQEKDFMLLMDFN